MSARILGGIAACWLLFCGSCENREQAAAPVQAPPVMTATVPSSVQRFMEIQYPKAVLERQNFLDAGALDFYPKYTLLFYCQIPDWRDPKLPAWLVGYRIARHGQGVVPENRLAVIDRFGMGGDHRENGPLAALPEGCAGDNAVAFELMPRTWAFAVTRFVGRHAHYDLRIFTLAASPRELLRYGEDQKPPEKRSWYSTFYFVDADQDGKTDAVVDRIVRDFEQMVMWKEYVLYRFDAETMGYAEPSRISEERFREILGEKPGEWPSIRQEGIPFERGFEENLRVVPGPI